MLAGSLFTVPPPPASAPTATTPAAGVAAGARAGQIVPAVFPAARQGKHDDQHAGDQSRQETIPQHVRLRGARGWRPQGAAGTMASLQIRRRKKAMPVPPVEARVNSLRTQGWRSGRRAGLPAWPRNTGKVGGCGRGTALLFGGVPPLRGHSMNRSARRILIGVGAGLALLLLLLVLVPVLFAGKISDRVKTELNRTLLARVDWRSAGLGFFHDFPNLTLTLDGFSIVGRREVPGRHPGRDPPLPGRGRPRQRDPRRPRRLGPDRGPGHRARPSAARAQGAGRHHRQLEHHPPRHDQGQAPPRRGSRWR